MPHITLDLNDDEEFRSCQFCKSHLTAFHNKKGTLALAFDQTNCEKCGKFIEIEPTDPEDEGFIFMCSHSDCHNAHKHCLCYECGILYDLESPNCAEGDCAESDPADLVIKAMEQVLGAEEVTSSSGSSTTSRE